MAMTTISAKEVQKRATAILKEQRLPGNSASKMPLNGINDIKRILHMAELAEIQDTLLYVTFGDLVTLGLAEDFILGENYPDRRPLT